MKTFSYAKTGGDGHLESTQKKPDIWWINHNLTNLLSHVLCQIVPHMFLC